MSAQLYELEQAHTIYGWQRQSVRSSVIFAKGKGINLWDVTGKRYVDFCSGQINVNVGYGHPKVISAIQNQVQEISYVAPMFATEARIRLAAKVAQHMPGDLQYVFFTNSGSESIENAIKIARAVTGRTKIYSAWQSYHGATAGAAAISGDPRRLYAEPTMPGTVKFHYPNCYRCPFGQEEYPRCKLACLSSLRNQLIHDGPETVAAIVLEPIAGTSGLYIPPAQFLTQVREICDEYGILLVFDETMSGWGRSGRWFACEHFGVFPDIIATAKGITSGYVPLGATVVTKRIRDHFVDTAFVGGLTNEGHPLACAAGLACIEAYEEDTLVERSEQLGQYLIDKLLQIQDRHPSVGDVRSKGLFGCLELTADRKHKRPLAGYRDSYRHIASEISRRLFAMDLFVIAKWDFIFLAPALVVTQSEIDDALEKIDIVLGFTDKLIAP